MYKVALVEDEDDLRNLVVKYLKNEGYEVTSFRTGEEAEKVNFALFHLWILDIMLPGAINGYDLVKKIKEENPKTAVIFTSARDQDIDRIMGLELGSDDYLPKPYSIRELMLRVKILLNRVYSSEIERQMVLYENYVINIDKRVVTEKDLTISLTSKEYDLLIFFLQNKNKAFSRDQILDNVWGTEYYGSDRVVDDLMRRLRQKMPQLRIETIYGYGYRLL